MLGIDEACETEAAILLSGGQPAGGVYSGTGVTGTNFDATVAGVGICLLYTSPSPRDRQKSRMPSSA